MRGDCLSVHQAEHEYACVLPPFHPHLLRERVRFAFGRMGLGKVIKYGRCMDAVPMNQVLIPRVAPPSKLVQFPFFDVRILIESTIEEILIRSSDFLYD